jgi:hypothetical protein
VRNIAAKIRKRKKMKFDGISLGLESFKTNPSRKGFKPGR